MGPLNPAPKPSVVRSYASRVVVPDGSVPSFGRPRRRPATGTARITRTAIAETVKTTGRRVTRATQREAGVRRGVVTVCPILRRARRLSTFMPETLRIAGVNVNEISSATKTPKAAERPIWLRKPTPTTDRPARATMTVAPAKKTAEPAVPAARRIDSCTPMPASRLRRCRLTMKSA